MSTEWDEYLASEEYMDSLVDEPSDEELQRQRAVGWFTHSTTFWDWRLA